MSLPNRVTVLRIILTPVFAVFLFLKGSVFTYLALSIFLFASITDWYDGYAARKYRKITPTGQYLDPLADKVLIATAFSVFTFLNYVEFWMLMVIVSRDVVVTGLRSYAMSRGKHFSTSILAKWKTFSQILAIYFLLIWHIVTTSQPQAGLMGDLFNWMVAWHVVENLMLFITVFTLTTGISYLYENRRDIKSLAIAFYRVFVPTNVR